MSDQPDPLARLQQAAAEGRAAAERAACELAAARIHATSAAVIDRAFGLAIAELEQDARRNGGRTDGAFRVRSVCLDEKDYTDGFTNALEARIKAEITGVTVRREQRHMTGYGSFTWFVVTWPAAS